MRIRKDSNRSAASTNGASAPPADKLGAESSPAQTCARPVSRPTPPRTSPSAPHPDKPPQASGVTLRRDAHRAQARAFVPVLLVPGYMQSGEELAATRAALKQAGAGTVEILSLRGANGQLLVEKTAEEIAEAVDRLKAATGARHVDVVAFSYGALASRVYLQRLGGTASVRRFVSICGPQGGTPMAAVGGGPGMREVLPDSRLLKGLAAELEGRPDLLEPTALFTLSTPYDLRVLPEDSTRLPGSTHIRFDVPVHAKMLDSLAVQRVVVEALGSPKPSERGLNELAGTSSYPPGYYDAARQFVDAMTAGNARTLGLSHEASQNLVRTTAAHMEALGAPAAYVAKWKHIVETGISAYVGQASLGLEGSYRFAHSILDAADNFARGIAQGKDPVQLYLDGSRSVYEQWTAYNIRGWQLWLEGVQALWQHWLEPPNSQHLAPVEHLTS